MRKRNILIVTSDSEDILDDFYPFLNHLLLRSLSGLSWKKNVNVSSVFSEDDLIARLEMERIDCVVMLGMKELSQATIERTKEAGVKLLCLESDRWGMSALVQWNQEDGAYQLGKYLLGLGHRNIVWFGARHRDRFSGLEKAFAEFNADFSHLRICECGTSPSNVCAKICDLFEEKSLPTAMIFFYDGMAARAAKTIRNFGLSIPEEISIASFGDTKYAQYMTPELTSVGFNRDEFVQQTIAALQCLLVDRQASLSSKVIDAKLMIRQSCGPVARKGDIELCTGR